MKITVNPGTLAFEQGTKKKFAPKYQFNSTRTYSVEGTQQRGCNEFAKTDYLITVEGKTLAVSGDGVNQQFFQLSR